jgi:hypothetical protein
VQFRRPAPCRWQPCTGHTYGNKNTRSATLRLLSDSADATTRTYEARYVLNGDWQTRRWGQPSR